jgi:hypothetical protein
MGMARSAWSVERCFSIGVYIHNMQPWKKLGMAIRQYATFDAVSAEDAGRFTQ